MNESDVKCTMVKAMVKDGGYARRIEDQYSVGMPDLILIPKGGPVFMAEVKIVRLVSGKYKPSPRQLIELERIEATGAAVPIMIGYFLGDLYINNIGAEVCVFDAHAHGPVKLVTELLRIYNEKRPA